ncbi:MAG: hypothetical protein Q8K07_02330 [Methylicorpusculum sp.]|uniref:phosphoribosyltransferase-like protein n=1 Tax=Methylicorpusculum sp. TaxID=2713644 RepID=UPI002731C466|nr:hypothetical protein [Methylicorpusculum sp.]MDP2200829.1 hypothetical protein [Methylicorpusculum sp.]
MDKIYDTNLEDVNIDALKDFLKKRIMVLSGQWENRVDWALVESWLDNFNGASGEDVETEQLHALYLLSQFMYFGNREVKVLLRALYRDLFYIPLIQEIRNNNSGIRDQTVLTKLVENELNATRFLGVGNPSESGVHLLYFFRQVNGLSKDHFMDTAQVMKRTQDKDGYIIRVPRYPNVQRFVFVDDICGSGETAVRYSDDFLGDLLSVNKNACFYYFSLFATSDGLSRVRNKSLFKENCGSVFVLDSTYRCLEKESRFLKIVPPGIDPEIVIKVARIYGELICKGHSGGYKDSQMLLGFSHNTPDNTLPIIWMDGNKWAPIFKRYPKI